MDTKITKRYWLESVITSVRLLRDDFLRFMLLTIIALLCGSGGIALVFGCLYGTVVVALIVIFALGALHIRFNSKNKRQAPRKRRHCR
jgi:membrane protein required for beta-lactamase induction